MGMVYCRGCGKEIHETAPTCPLCGAPQLMTSIVAARRNIGVLIFWSVIWTIVFWLLGLVLTGIIIGITNPKDAYETGQKMGGDLSGIYLVISLCLSIGLTIYRKLPGTK